MFSLTRRIAVLLCSITAIFFILRVLPGDAVTAQLIESGASEQQIATRINQLRLNDPIFVQYLGYLLDVSQGNWGYSLSNGLPVFELLLPPLGHTVIISTISLIGASLLGIGLGVTGILKLRRLEYFAKLTLFLGMSTPVFATSILLLTLFGSFGSEQYLLPVFVLTFHGAGTIGRVTYTVLDKQQTQSFVRTAFAKGLRKRRVILQHIIPAAMVPIIAVIALQYSFLVSGTVIVETIFGIHGIGRLILNATLKRDYPVVQGAVIIISVFVTLANASADLLYRFFDPRLRWQ